MQARLFLGHLSLILYLGCEACGPHAGPSEGDAGAPGQARTGETSVFTPPTGTLSMDAAQPTGATDKVDAGPARASESGRDGDSGSEVVRTACADDGCAQPVGECDDNRPCDAADMHCVDHACAADPQAPPAAWQRSPWSSRVGLVGDDDTTLWCTPVISQEGTNAPTSVTSQLDRVALDGNQQRATTASFAAQRVQIRCFAEPARSGAATLVTSGWSVDGEQDSVRVRCPAARPFGALPQCQLATEAKPPLVYAGPTCGDGTSGVSRKPAVQGQWIGDHYELSTPNKPLFNNTGKVAVMGTDLGYQFLAQGRMYVGFGDTWENEASFPAANGYRGNVLAYTHDFDPADDNGIVLEGFETAPGRPNVAIEVVRSPHDQTGNTEFTAIGAAGFGLTEGTDQYRFLWFAAIKKWDPFTTTESTLAWSQNLGPFTRGDNAPNAHPPRWPFDSYFGPGAIWVDREHGYVYFFGVRTYQPGQPIRLARVRATSAAVLDHLQYEYWTGSAWQHPDPKDEYALVRAQDAAFNLIPGSAQQNNRPEMSVAYNPYVGRFTMMLQNDATPFEDEAQTYLEQWEAEAIEGPWTRVDTGDALVLPPHQYGPYLSEQTLSQGGRDVHFALSDWNLLPLSLGQPYVVALWNMVLERRARPGCTY